jgi:hypothetical protein
MEKTNQRKRVGRKSSIEKIYLSEKDLFLLVEVSKKLGDYPLSSLFTSNISIDLEFRYIHFFRWKLELHSVNDENGRLQYKFKTTTRDSRVDKHLLLLELEKDFVVELILVLNSQRDFELKRIDRINQD